ncbi:hypothetical protein B0T17DRAFT_637709 [Bombardia bombarda]|uniref:F-box domain-containing protein n=1 Tax=Bombardia bombarda TaxID=252184 RepID=A0AA39XBP3_9PEZI|nr:hypothetical protein B0T17DRAFT_637709 [Bombardia bombarda]
MEANGSTTSDAQSDESDLLDTDSDITSSFVPSQQDRLSELPNEILTKICDFISPAGNDSASLARLGQTSKELRAVVEPCLYRHIKSTYLPLWKTEWPHYLKPSRPGSLKVLMLLRTLAAKPHCKEHVRSIDLFRHEFWWIEADLFHPCDECHREPFKDADLMALGLMEGRFYNGYCEHRSYAEDDAALLLSVAPNVTEAKISVTVTETSQNLLARGIHPWNSSNSLKKLELVFRTHCGHRPEETDLNDIAGLWIVTPNLEGLTISGCGMVKGGPNLSSLKSLILNDCWFTTDDISTVLANLPELRHFKKFHSDACSWADENADHIFEDSAQPSEVLACLLPLAARLKRVVITHWHIWPAPDVSKLIWTFSQFPALKSLGIDIQALYRCPEFDFATLISGCPELKHLLILNILRELPGLTNVRAIHVWKGLDRLGDAITPHNQFPALRKVQLLHVKSRQAMFDYMEMREDFDDVFANDILRLKFERGGVEFTIGDQGSTKGPCTQLDE